MLQNVYYCLLDVNITANINSGIVIAVPIPEHAALLGEEIDQAILMALKEAKYLSPFCTIRNIIMICLTRAKDISGKDITPYVLQRVNEMTKGKSLEASILTTLSFSSVLLECLASPYIPWSLFQ